MSGEWQTFTLAQLGRVVTGKTPKTSDPNNFGGQIPFVTPTDMDGCKTMATTARYLSELGASTVKSSVIPAGSVMVSCIGSDMGKSVIAKHRCVTNQQINSVVVDAKFSSEFVYYNLSMRKAELQHLASGGSTMPILNKGMFSEIKIDLPPLAEQLQITNTLSTLDDRITLLRETNATLEAIAQTLFKSWFVDFDPVRAKLECRAPEGMDEATARLFPDSFEESELGLVPRGWVMRTMADVSTVGIGKTPPRKEQHWFSEAPSDVRWVSIRDMGAIGVYATRTSEFLTQEAVDKFNVRQVPDNTVLMSFKMTIGRVAITDGEMTTNEAIAHFRLTPDAPLTTEYIYLHLKQFDFSTLSSTSSIADAVNSKTVREIPILVPAPDVVAAFQSQVGWLFAKLKNTEQQAQTLATLRDTLLPRLISGQLRLPDVQAAAEEALA
jgi:type I restriction enzyme, S subunit